MDLLITLHRRTQKLADILHVRPTAQRVFRSLLGLRYRSGKLVRAVQNERTWWLVPSVALRGEFAEFETIQWLREVIKPGMTAIDVGANVGQMTLEMAHLVGPGGRIFAIEPAPGNLHVLRKHVTGNGFDDRVTIIEAACSARDGETIEMKIFGETAETVGSGHTVIFEETVSDNNPAIPTINVSVSTVSIDDLCRRHALTPGVVKIDVEGAEILVLRGATEVLSNARPFVRFGFHPFAFANPDGASTEILDLLRATGYRLDGQAPGIPLEFHEYSATPTEIFSQTPDSQLS